MQPLEKLKSFVFMIFVFDIGNTPLNMIAILS